MAYERDNPMTCKEAQVICFMYMKDDPGLTVQQREEFETHLLICSACAEEYEENKWLMDLLKKHWPISEDTKKLLQAAGYDSETHDGPSTSSQPYHPMTIEESWEDLKRRCPSLAEACRRDERRRKLRRVAWRIGKAVAAACILIAIGIGWLALRNGGSDQAAPGITTSPESAAAFAELVTDQGRQPLALNQPITAGTQPQEILLGGMHRVVMNRHTKATFSVEPQRTEGPYAGKVPYKIQLAQGELYVEVVPGNPFTVKTTNARLDITGTEFDVVADGDKTELTLLKGSVRFSALDCPQEAVSVTAGHASTITGWRAPSAPSPVDALAAVAWARNLALNKALAQVELDDSFLDMTCDAWIQLSPPDLDSIDYDIWLEQKQDWFAREFPWTFRAQKHLFEQHGIEVDYIELLMTSGDVWQFNYPLPLGQPIPVFDPTAIERLAMHYKVGGDELLKMVQSSSLKSLVANLDFPTTGPSKGCPAEVYLSALKDWQSAIVSAANNPDGLQADLFMFSLHAGTYLGNTRTAAYLWVKENPEKAEALLANERYRSGYLSSFLPVELKAVDPLAEFLANQVATTHMAVETTQELFTAPKGTGCEAQAATLGKQLSEHILTLTAKEAD